MTTDKGVQSTAANMGGIAQSKGEQDVFMDNPRGGIYRYVAHVYSLYLSPVLTTPSG